MTDSPVPPLLSDRLEREKVAEALQKRQRGESLTWREIDLVRKHERRLRKDSQPDYEDVKRRAAERSRIQSLAGREIGSLPEVENPERRAACENDFRLFCETYCSEVFCLKWADDHLKALALVETVVSEGGLYAFAMPRGSGKTSICETACMWAALYGKHEFVSLIGPTDEAAKEMLASIKTDLETNETLAVDFPEVCYPIIQLDGIANRANGQLCQGVRTRIGWREDRIILPTIDGSVAGGVIIGVAGLTGRIRGLKYKRTDGRTVRPSLVLPDDPQTDESAYSQIGCETRERLITRAILNLAGPGRKIAALMPCTVICPGDVADRLLDRQRHPEWQGQRTKALYKFPIDKKHWGQYAEIRADALRAEKGLGPATAYYVEHQKIMDRGARVAWPARFDDDEVSAIQHCMNLFIQDPKAFYAEHQNEPQRDDDDAGHLVVETVMGRLNGRQRGQVPPSAIRLTADVDLHDKLLYWCVCAWEEKGTGYVLDYGTYPDQERRTFTMAQARMSLARKFPRAGTDGAIQSGLEALVTTLLGRDWQQPGGGKLRVDRLLIDMGYKPEIAEAVKRKCGGSSVMLAKGVGIRAGNKPIVAYQRRPGWQFGHNWYVPRVIGTREFPHVMFDTNFWKAELHRRFGMIPGDPGAMTLYGSDQEHHRTLAEHLCNSESWQETKGQGRTVHEWRQRPERLDNHWLDCLVACMVAASMVGIKLGGELARTQVQQRKRYTQADLRRR